LSARWRCSVSTDHSGVAVPARLVLIVAPLPDRVEISANNASSKIISHFLISPYHLFVSQHTRRRYATGLIHFFIGRAHYSLPAGCATARTIIQYNASSAGNIVNSV